ncbi:MAG TPA: acyl-CoA thioesterase [Fimbriimonas sp.]|nr:acyl-CoA thioesterase [Fimbriimonas sp.]
MNPSPRTPSSTRTLMSEVMTPNDANFLGKVFGGRILALMDLCAYVTAARFSGEICVTAGFDKVDFHEPIEVGEVVSLAGFVSYVGRSSIEVTIEVHAENVLKGIKRHTNTARITMVAIKGDRPVEVPRLLCETREEKILFLLGRFRRENRAEYAEERRKRLEELEAAGDPELDRLLEE